MESRCSLCASKLACETVLPAIFNCGHGICLACSEKAHEKCITSESQSLTKQRHYYKPEDLCPNDSRQDLQSVCPLCCKTWDSDQVRPVVGSCGHTICLSCSKKVNEKCPICDRQTFTKPVINFLHQADLKDCIVRWSEHITPLMENQEECSLNENRRDRYVMVHFYEACKELLINFQVGTLSTFVFSDQHKKDGPTEKAVKEWRETNMMQLNEKLKNKLKDFENIWEKELTALKKRIEFFNYLQKELLFIMDIMDDKDFSLNYEFFFISMKKKFTQIESREKEWTKTLGNQMDSSSFEDCHKEREDTASSSLSSSEITLVAPAPSTLKHYGVPVFNENYFVFFKRLKEGCRRSVWGATSATFGTCVVKKYSTLDKGPPSGLSCIQYDIQKGLYENSLLHSIDTKRKFVSIHEVSHHAHIVNFYGYMVCFGYNEGSTGLPKSSYGIGHIYELLAGGTLKQMINGNHSDLEMPVLDPERARNYAKQIAQALTHLHEKYHVVHRHIQSSNIFLTGDFSVAKIGDFGNLWETDIDQESLMYMAPEIVKKQQFVNYDFKSDVYSFALLVYAMLFKREPFATEQKTNSLNFHLLWCMLEEGRRPIMDRSVIESNHDMVALIENGWRTKPHERPTIKEMLEKLQEISEKVFRFSTGTNFETKIDYSQ